MAAANKSQELIQRLLLAEKEAEAIINTAKKNRLEKLRKAKEAADEELKEFRAKEEEKFQRETGSKAAMDPALDLKEATLQEVKMVQMDYDNNKAKTIAYVVDKVLDVMMCLTPTQKQALKTGGRI